MNIALQHSRTPAGNDGGHFGFSWIKARLAWITESFWFGLSFVLFLLMGPFSAVVVLIGLASLATEEKREQMREPARL